MIERRLFLSVSALATFATLSGCSRMFPETLRFKMTVEVETPGGLRSGSSVMELAAWRNSWAFNGAVRGRSLDGEAVFVALPEGRNLFATLKSQERELFDAVLGAFDPSYNNDWVESIERIKRRRKIDQVVELPSSHVQERYSSGNAVQDQKLNYPLFVTFTDIRDPSSAHRLYTQDISHHFGSGYDIRRITVQRTKDKLSDNIDQILTKEFWQLKSRQKDEWVKSGSRANDNPYFRTFQGSLNRSDFSSEH